MERFQANGAVKIYEDGILAHTITLTGFQGSATYTHSVASDSLGPHTWRAVLEVTASGITVSAEDTDIESVIVCQQPPGPEVGGDLYPTNKLIILTPFIVLAIVLAVGATIVVRRRLHQS